MTFNRKYIEAACKQLSRPVRRGRVRPSRLLPLTGMLALLVSCGTTPSPPVPAATAESKPSVIGKIVRLDPQFDALVPANAAIEKIASGFQFTEGPLWFANGTLWFSDVTGNVVRQWSAADGKVTAQMAWSPARTASFCFASTVTGALCKFQKTIK
jgi:hypothetical protein